MDGFWSAGARSPHFVASFAGNFVAFVESIWWSLTEARRRGESEPRMHE